ELIARSNRIGFEDAARTLAADLFEKDPVPLAYSRLPLEEAGTRPLDLRRDLLLSHFDIEIARDLGRREYSNLSEAASAYIKARRSARSFNERLERSRQTLRREIARLQSTLDALSTDQTRFENPSMLRRYGELLLANIPTGRVEGRTARVVDYYE